jgi:hypothetical protein
MPSRTFRNKKSLRKTKRKRNAGQLKDAYLAMSVGGKIEVYKLKKAKKSVKLTGGMWPFSSEQSQVPLLDQSQEMPAFGSPQPTMLENITDKLNIFKPKQQEQQPFV